MDKYIWELENAVPHNFCEKLIERFELDDRKVQGRTLGGVNKNVKNTIDLPLCRFDDWDHEKRIIADFVSKSLIKYHNYLLENNLDKNRTIAYTLANSGIGPSHLQKQEVGGFYDWHHDYDTSRVLTCIIYLNDVEEDCGGTTDFINGRSILPKAGKILIFPACMTHIHRGKKLEKGVKYIATNFIIFQKQNT